MRVALVVLLCGCGSVSVPFDTAPEIAVDVLSVDAVDVPMAMDVVPEIVADVPPGDVTCSPACFFFEECIGGRCVGRPDVQDVAPEASACAPTERLCAFGDDAGSRCYDLQTSWERCGACDVQCNAGSSGTTTCTRGVCTCPMATNTACPFPGAGVIRIVMVCVDLQSNSTHCGTCGNRCVAPATCRAGRCMN